MVGLRHWQLLALVSHQVGLGMLRNNLGWAGVCRPRLTAQGKPEGAGARL
jgi:hypothetical protein